MLFAIVGKGIYHRRSMVRAINITAALLCLVCVLALCIAPSVDIPQTTLKALQVIMLLMLNLIAGASLLADLVRLAFLGRSFHLVSPMVLVRASLPPRQTSCVQQC